MHELKVHVSASDILYAVFMVGNYTVCRPEKRFANVWTDMALEQYANCHSKAKMGGTIGVTKKEEAYKQWSRTVYERGAITEKTCSMLRMH